MERSAALKFILTAIISLSVCVWAQMPEGTLTGSISDAQGARVAGATITLAAVGTGVHRAITSNNIGEFGVPALPPGVYHLRAQAKGFAPAEVEVRVNVGSNPKIEIKLTPAAASQTVQVQAERSSVTETPLDLTSTTLKATAGRTDLTELPLQSRSFANVAFLAPGTEPVEPSDPTKARIQAVSTGGSSGLNNELSVDGGDNSDDYIGGFLQNFSPDAVQEFAFRTTEDQADTGRTTAGSVEIVTRHGTNDWHGDAAFYDRDAALNARDRLDNPAPNPKQPFSRQNYIGSLGGPIRKDKLWFFFNTEFVRENASTAYNDNSITQLNALSALAADGLIPGVPSITVPSSLPIPFRDVLGLVRFDYSQSEKSQWYWRTAIDTFTQHNSLVQQGALPSVGATAHNNYLNSVLAETYNFSPTWLGKFTFDVSGLHLTQSRNSDYGFALAFPFTTTNNVLSGFETFGDQQYVLPGITAFPVLRNQEKYQWRYDVSHVSGKHAPRFGISFIHEPVLSGALSSSGESLLVYAQEPMAYLAQQTLFQTITQSVETNCGPTGMLTFSDGSTCTFTPAGDGSFSQNVQRLGMYAEDSWQATPRLLVNYGVRYDTTFGLFIANGRSQADNPLLPVAETLGVPGINGIPHDYRYAVAPRIGLAYSLTSNGNTVLRAGFGQFYNDLGQIGWTTAFEEVNATNVSSVTCPPPGAPDCAVIDPHYHSPYNLHFIGGVQHVFNAHWGVSADYVHEDGMHGYRNYTYTYNVPGFPNTLPANSPIDELDVYRSDNRSQYNGLLLHAQGDIGSKFNVITNYTLSKADTWGCVLAELLDYVNRVCNAGNAFGAGDYGPSGEDVRQRFVFAFIYHAPAGFLVSSLSQFESARPFTLTNAAASQRAEVNGATIPLDSLRGDPYEQVDLRVARPFKAGERTTVTPFAEFFNLLNRANAAAFYITDVAAIPGILLAQTCGTVPTPGCSPAGIDNAIGIGPQCATLGRLGAGCYGITSLNQLRFANGAFGDFFGLGTTVGIPFAAQLGVRVVF